MKPSSKVVFLASLWLTLACAPGSPPGTQLQAGSESTPAPQIRLGDVTLARVASAEITAPGRIEADPNRTSRVNLSAPGRVTRVFVRLGDSVQAGQPLLSVTSNEASEAQAAYRIAEASLRQSKANLSEARIGVSKATTALRQAELDFRRTDDLFRHDAIAQKEVQFAETALRQARADVESARVLVQQRQAEIDSTRASQAQALARLEFLGVQAEELHPELVVRSPLTGKILELSVVAGEFRNDIDNPVMTIADLSSIFIVSSVPESAIRHIRLQDSVEITLDAYPGKTFSGKVSRIADTLDPKTRTIQVMTPLANPSGEFRPEMFGRIHHVHRPQLLPVIPATAVLQQGDGKSVVYVEKAPGEYEHREVQLGPRHQDQVAILDGLKAGQRVVVDGAVLLKP